MTRIMISAGELSGDEHGANLLAELKAIYPQGEFFGMGGRNLRAAGLEMIVDIERTGTVMGFTEIMGGLLTTYRTWRSMTRLFKERPPAVLVIINYSEFNLRLARIAKKHAIKVLFYIPPQVWAWRPARVAEIDRVCDVVATIFPFERSFYAARGCHKVCSVGHPFVTHFEKHRLDTAEARALRESLGLDSNRPIVLLFPGSRKKEILAHLDFVFESFATLHRGNPAVQGLLVSASAEWVPQFSAKVPPGLPIKVQTGDSLKLLQIGDVGLIKSGTSNLQATFANLPFVMFYRPSRISAFIIRRLVKGISEYSIVNILRPRTVPEVVGEVLDPRIAAENLERLLTPGEARAQMQAAFAEIVRSLTVPEENLLLEGCVSASQRTAKLVQALVDGTAIFC